MNCKEGEDLLGLHDGAKVIGLVDNLESLLSTSLHRSLRSA